MNITVARRVPLLLLLLASAGAFGYGLWQGMLPGSVLLDYHHSLQAHTEAAFVRTALAYVVVFMLVVVLALPGGAVMSLSGGYLFGPTLGTGLAICGATLGAVLTLAVINSSLRDVAMRLSEGYFTRIRRAFYQAPVRYLLLLRLVPVFPFFAVNIALALLGVRLSTFTWTTVVGLVPSTLAFTIIGHGMGDQLERGELPGREVLLEPVFLGSIAVLVLLLTLALVLRRRL